LAKIIAWPVWFLLSYLIKVVDYLASFPLAAVEFRSASLIILLGYYLVLILIIYKCSRSKKLSIQS